MQGEYRIIDGYHSEYILASFKNGMYDGLYRHFKRNVLAEESTYKDGWREGYRKTYYGDGKTCRAKERSWKESCTVSVSHTIKMEKSKRRSAIKWETRTDATANTRGRKPRARYLL